MGSAPTRLRFACDFVLDEARRQLVTRGMGVQTIEQAQQILPMVAAAALTEDTLELHEFTADRIRYDIVSPAVRKVVRQGRPAFANTLIPASEITLNDGVAPADSPQWQAIDELARERQYAHHWGPADMLVVDNTSSMHGRLAHTAAVREVAVRMGWYDPKA